MMKSLTKGKDTWQSVHSTTNRIIKTREKLKLEKARIKVMRKRSRFIWGEGKNSPCLKKRYSGDEWQAITGWPKKSTALDNRILALPDLHRRHVHATKLQHDRSSKSKNIFRNQRHVLNQSARDYHHPAFHHGTSY